MKKRVTQNGLTVNAIVGTYCVFLGFDMAKSDAKNLLVRGVARFKLTVFAINHFLFL